jgi:hypothetical protein
MPTSMTLTLPPAPRLVTVTAPLPMKVTTTATTATVSTANASATSMSVNSSSSASTTDRGVEKDLANLRQKLEKVVKSREGVPPLPPRQRQQQPGLLSPNSTTLPLPHLNKTSATLPQRPVLGSSSSNIGGSGKDATFRGRYNFDASITIPWKPSFSNAHSRAATHPALRITPPSTSPIPWPDKVKARGVPIIRTIPPPVPLLGSPRDLDEEMMYGCQRGAHGPRTASANGSDVSYFSSRIQSGMRNHKRASFNEGSMGGFASAVKLRRTPPGTPLLESFSIAVSMPPSQEDSDSTITPMASETRLCSPLSVDASLDLQQQSSLTSAEEDAFVSTSPVAAPASLGLGFASSYFDGVQIGDDAGSALSTPSFASPTSSSQPSTVSSPAQSFLDYNPASEDPMSALSVTTGGVAGINTISPKTSYRQFLNRWVSLFLMHISTFRF